MTSVHTASTRCEKCDSQFSHLGHYKDHMKRVHDKVKDHHCTMCDFSAIRCYMVKSHMQRVHNQKILVIQYVLMCVVSLWVVFNEEQEEIALLTGVEGNDSKHNGDGKWVWGPPSRKEISVRAVHTRLRLVQHHNQKVHLKVPKLKHLHM